MKTTRRYSHDPDVLLVPAGDHCYRVVKQLEEVDVAFGPRDDRYYEYHGEDYLEPGDVVVRARVVL